jgi:hypothetical protein
MPIAVVTLLDTAAPTFLTAWASTTAEYWPADGHALSPDRTGPGNIPSKSSGRIAF